MNIKELKEMISLMRDNDITDFEMEKDGFKIRLQKGGGLVSPENIVVSAPRPVQYVQDQAAAPAPAAAPEAAAPAKDDANVDYIKSPMVGTFYKSPSPDADAFVAPGQKIGEGDTLCIVEAMKLMNEIKSEVSGTIVEILVENGQAVEFDQPLFKIKKG